MKAAIVSTVRRWSAEVDAWAWYHRKIGFDNLFIFLDDASEVPSALDRGLSLFHCDVEHWRSFAKEPLAGELDCERAMNTPEWRHPQRVMVRQMLNVKRAIQLALDAGVSWLLHIDGDELFFAEEQSLAEHFDSLEHAGISQVRYLNLEAVICGEDQSDHFRSMTLFKRNPAALAQSQQQYLDRILDRRLYFASYATGKSAVRLSREVHPAGVYAFTESDGVKGRSLLAKPAVLHYPYSTFERFRDKHASLGDFDSTVFLGQPWKPAALLGAARDALRLGGTDALKELYREHIRFDPGVCDDLRQAGILTDITRPAAMIRDRAC